MTTTENIIIIKPLDDAKQHQYFLCQKDNREIVLSLNHILQHNIDTQFHKSAKCFDHLGIIYNTRTEMYKHYDTDKSKVKYRKQHGYSLEQALTIKHIDGVNDHTGKHFKSKTQMCNHWHINHVTYQSRIDAGWSQERALTEPVPGINITQDHLHNSFESEEQLCKYYKISKQTLHKRINKKWSLEKSLTTPVKRKVQKRKIKDHLGNEFESLVQLAEYWNIPYSRVKNGLKLKWSIEKILTTPPRNKITDHLGNTFENKIELCKYWQISRHVLKNRLAKGYTLQEALTKPIDITKISKNITKNYTIVKCIEHPFYLVLHDEHEIIMSYNAITEKLYIA